MIRGFALYNPIRSAGSNCVYLWVETVQSARAVFLLDEDLFSVRIGCGLGKGYRTSSTQSFFAGAGSTLVPMSTDRAMRVVLMMQVENEVGMIPEPRDYSPDAEGLYQGAVPQALLSRRRNDEIGPEVMFLWEQSGNRIEGS